MVAFQPRGGVLNMARPITLRRARSCCGTHLVAWDIVVLVSMTHSPLTGAARAVAPGSRALRPVTPDRLGAQGGREGRPLGRDEAELQDWVAAMLWDLSETVSPGGPRVT